MNAGEGFLCTALHRRPQPPYVCPRTPPPFPPCIWAHRLLADAPSPRSLRLRHGCPAVVRHVDWDIVKCLVIAGPGFAKDQFKGFLDAGAGGRGALLGQGSCRSGAHALSLMLVRWRWRWRWRCLLFL